MGLEVNTEGQAKLIAYVHLLTKWNRVYSLTAVREPSQMVSRHLLDCLALLPYLEGDRMADLGSGAGLPGLVLAIARPEQRWVLLDSREKKTRFLTHAVFELGLGNTSVVRERLEHYRPGLTFSTFTARALGSLQGLIDRVSALCTSASTLLVMKGAYPSAELAALKTPLDPEVHRLAVPGLDAERHVVVIRLPAPAERAGTVP